MKRLLSLALWLTLLSIAFFTGPDAAPDTQALVQKLMTGHFEGLNRAFIALFNLMGVWPMVMAVLLRFDRSLWKWPFILCSFGLGAYALLPWFVLRPWGLQRQAPTARVDRWLGHRGVHLFLAGAAVSLTALFFSGDLAGFATLFRTQQFTWVMSFDFLAMSLGAALLVADR